MEMFIEEENSFLVKLGLTVSEAKVYLALTRIGTSQIGSISKATRIHRPNLYQILRSLKNKCLIEEGINSPAKYKAVPPQQAINMLIKFRQTQITELKTQAKKITKDLEKKQAQNQGFKEGSNQFVVIPGKQGILNRLREALQKTQNSLDVVTTEKRFSSAIMEFSKDYNDALRRGVKIRIAVEEHQPEKTALNKVQTLEKNQNFQVEYIPPPSPGALVSIFDKKEAFVTISATANMDGTSALWSNDSSFVAIIQNYFENIWKTALCETNEELLESNLATNAIIQAIRKSKDIKNKP